MRWIFLILPLFCFSQTITLSDADVKAFYTADGWGQDATGGRGGTIIHVTNTNATGPGSLYAALLTNTTRTIVFDVGGTIDMNDTILYTQYPNVTIAGETAPGGGIAIRNGELNINSSNVVVRHLRARGEGTPNRDNLKIQGGTLTNIILDHCSSGFGADENLSVTNASYVTIQNSIFSDELGSGNILFYANVSKLSFYKNLSVWNGSRNPRSSASPTAFEVINSYWYGYNAGGGNTVYENETDWIGNVWDNDVAGAGYLEVYLSPIPDGNPGFPGNIALTRAYFSDNLNDGGAAQIDSDFNPYIEGSPIDPSGITAISGSLTRSITLTTAGAGRGIQGLDSYDSGLITDVTSEVASNFASTPVFPTLATGTQYIDDDGDGLSNEFEIANGGSIAPSTRPATATLVDGTVIDQSGVTSYATSGYTYMDIFLGELAGDWGTGTPGGEGGGTTTPNALKNAINAMLIAH